MIFLSQQIGDDSFIVRKANVFMSFIHRHAIVGHDGRCVCSKCSFEWDKMIIKIFSRVYLALLKRKMRIEPFFLRATTRKMFGHCSHAGRTQFFSLEAEYVCPRHFCGKICVFTKRTTDAWPARFGGEINLRMQRLADACSYIFLP